VFEIEFYYKYAALGLLTPLVWLLCTVLLYSDIIKKYNNMKELKKILVEKGFNLTMIRPYNKEWKRMYVGSNLYKEASKVAEKAGYITSLYVNANMDSFLVKVK
jgi:hypothetical protein